MKIARRLPRFQQALRTMDVLRDREQWSRAQITSFQLQQLNRLWQYATASVPYYATLAREHGLPNEFGTLEEYFRRMPLLAKSTIKNSAKSFLAGSAEKGHWIYTGGSTGTPTPAYWSDAAHRESLAAKYRFVQSWGVDVFDRTTFLWRDGGSLKPGFAGALSRLRQPYLDRLRNRQRLSAYDLSRTALRRYIEEITRFDPLMIYGYSRALFLLAMEAERQEVARFHAPSLKVIVATAEPAWPHMMDKIEKTLGAPVAREYGACECGIMATDAPDRTMRVREDHVLLETLPRDDGQYDIVVTVLTNRAFPLIRYAIGDVTDTPITRPEQGFAILANVGGRNNDLLRSKTGDHVHWLYLEHAVAMSAWRVLRRFSVLQSADGSVLFKVELHDPAGVEKAKPDLEAMRLFFEKSLGGFPVRLEIVDRVEQTIGGKHRVVQSDLYDVDTSKSQPAVVHH